MINISTDMKGPNDRERNRENTLECAFVHLKCVMCRQRTHLVLCVFFVLARFGRIFQYFRKYHGLPNPRDGVSHSQMISKLLQRGRGRMTEREK